MVEGRFVLGGGQHTQAQKMAGTIIWSGVDAEFERQPDHGLLEGHSEGERWA